MIQRRAKVLRAPITRPGMKPAAKDLPSKEEPVSRGLPAGQSEVWDADAGAVDEGVALEGLEGVGVGDVSLAHMLPWHV